MVTPPPATVNETLFCPRCQVARPPEDYVRIMYSVRPEGAGRPKTTLSLVKHRSCGAVCYLLDSDPRLVRVRQTGGRHR